MAALHLRNRLPRRQGVERLARSECLNQCLSFAGHFLTEFWFHGRGPRLEKKITKARGIAISASAQGARSIDTFSDGLPFWPLGGLGFHIYARFPRSTSDPIA